MNNQECADNIRALELIAEKETRGTEHSPEEHRAWQAARLIERQQEHIEEQDEREGHMIAMLEERVGILCAAMGVDPEVYDRDQSDISCYDDCLSDAANDLDDQSSRIKEAVDLIEQCGGIDGGHHKQWVLDQVIRALVDDYERWVKDYQQGEEGPNTYQWDEGIAP